MIKELTVNTVIQWDAVDENSTPTLERILWINTYDNSIVVININFANALPEVRCIDEIVSCYEDGTIRLLNFYEKTKFAIPEEKIPEKQKQKRDNAWNTIKDLVKSEPDIYYQSNRGKLIKKTLYELNQGLTKKKTKKSIYKFLRRYWQYGKTPNCLLPEYDLCGGKGKERCAEGEKRGRNRKHDNDPKCGINITSKDRKEFLKGIKEFYKTSDKRPLQYAYEKTLFRQYIIGYKEENGVKIPILKSFDMLPTFTQFKYWCYKDNDIKEIIKSREGEKAYELRHRPVTGTSTQQAFGPGSRYQIDATIADVYLVNSLTRKKVIKRAVIYAVIDVFSRLVVGIHVGLEGPSWIGAMMALANAAMNKVEFCKKFGIDIKELDWPCEYTPELLTADRGELEGEKPNNLINSLGVDVEILPPYRADWKGIIESEFRKLNLGVILWLPGSIKKLYRERGDKDYRLGAALTLHEFTQTIIRCVLYYNNNRRMKWYDKNEFLIADKVRPIPRDLWNWGMENCTGRLKQFPEDIVKLNLMPSVDATVTYKGIKIDKYYYTCETANKENWFIKARMGQRKKIPLVHDPRDMRYAYIRSDNGKDYEKCYLLDSSKTYAYKYLEEVKEYLTDEKKEEYLYQHEELQAKAEFDAHVSHIVSNAINDTNRCTSDLSDNQRIEQIKEATSEEKNKNRQLESFNLPDNAENPLNASDFTNNDYSIDIEDDYIAPPRYID